MGIERNPWLHPMAGQRVTRSRFVLFGVGVLVVALLAYTVVFGAMDKAWFHEDESGWISSGYYYTDTLLARDFAWEKWTCPECHAWGSLNMQLGKWLIGVPLRLYSNTTKNGAAFFGLYDGTRTYEQNVAEERVPPPDILQRGRAASGIFGVLTCVLLFTVCYYFAGWLEGIIAVALTLANSTFIRMATHVMTDIHYNFFLLAGCLGGVYYVAQESRRGRWQASLGTGILAGLACSVKITGLAIGASLFAGLVVYNLALRRTSWRDALRDTAVFAVSALVVIYVLNPFFWPDFRPVNLGSSLQETASPLVAPVTSQPVEVNGTASSPPLRGIARVAEFPRMFARWNELMDDQQKIALWTGPRLVVIQQQTFLGQISFPVVSLFLLVGLAFCIYRVSWQGRRAQATLLVVPLVYFFVNYLLILGFLRLNWPRYYLPVEIAINMLAAVGAVALLTSLFMLARRAMTARKMAPQNLSE